MNQAIDGRDVRKRVTPDLLLELVSITQDADVAGTWLEEPDALCIATIERVTTKRSDDLIGWVHLRSSFSLNESPRQEDVVLARKWLQRNAASKAIYILINNVASSTKPRTLSGVAGGHNQNRKALVFVFDQSGEFTPCAESIDDDESFVVESAAVSIGNESEEKAEIPPSPKSTNSGPRTSTTLSRTSLTSVMSIPSSVTSAPQCNPSSTAPSSRPKDSIKTPPPPPPKPHLPLTSRSAQSYLTSPISSPTTPMKPASAVAADSPGFEPKFIRFGYLRKPDKMGFWVARMVVLDSRQRSLIYASFDRFGALLAPEHIYYSQITRVQLSVYSSRQFEVDVHATPVDLRLGSTVSNQMVTHRFLCDEEEDALEWITLLHKASPRLAQHAPPPPKPQKPAASSALFRSANSNPTTTTTPVAAVVVKTGHNAASRLNQAKVKAEPPTSRTALKRLHAAPPPPSLVKTPSATTKTITSNGSSTVQVPPPPPPFALRSIQVGGVDSRTQVLQKKIPPPPPPPILSSASARQWSQLAKTPPPPAAFPSSPSPATFPSSASTGQWSPLAKKPPPPPPPPLLSSASQKTPPPRPPLLSSAPDTSKKLPPPPPPPSSSSVPIISKIPPPPPPPLSSAVISSIKRRIPPAPPPSLSSSSLQPPAQKKIPPPPPPLPPHLTPQPSSATVKTIPPPPPPSQSVRSSLVTPAQKIIPPHPPLKSQTTSISAIGSPSVTRHQSSSQRSPRPRTTVPVSSSLIVERNYRVLSEIYSSDRQSHVSGLSSSASPEDGEVPVWMMPRSSRPRQAPAPPPRRTSPGYYNSLNIT